MKVLTTLTLLMICLAAIGQVHTEFKYPDSTEKGLTIQNSLPKGGALYIDPTGKKHVTAIFWTHITNETRAPLELTINFPADSFAIVNNYFKLLIPPDTMSLDKIPLYRYGIIDLKSSLDQLHDKPTMLRRTINSQGEFIFYVVSLYHEGVNGVIRAGLSLKDQDLFYRITGKPDFPVGRIVFKKL